MEKKPELKIDEEVPLVEEFDVRRPRSEPSDDFDRVRTQNALCDRTRVGHTYYFTHLTSCFTIVTTRYT